MKGGWKFFLNLDNIAKGARAGLVVSVFFAIFLAKGWFLMLGSAFAVAVCLFLSCIIAPSDNVARRALRKFYEDFDKEVITVTKRTGQVFKSINGWKINGRMRLKRSFDSKIIYPYVAGIAVGQNVEDRSVIISIMSLMKENATEHIKLRLADCSISVSDELNSKEEMVLCISSPELEDTLEFLIENIHVNRDFLQSLPLQKNGV